MAAPTYRYRVFFNNGYSRDVTARSDDGAKRTATYAEKLIDPRRSRRLKAVATERLWEVGYQAGKESK